MYLFPWFHVLCDLSSINSDRKHAIFDKIHIHVFLGDINF